MAGNGSSQPGSFDEFSGLSKLKSHKLKTGTDPQSTKHISANNMNLPKNSSDTGTKIFLGKKITGSTDIQKKLRSDTTSTKISIDTTTKILKEKPTTSKFSLTSIDPGTVNISRSATKTSAIKIEDNHTEFEIEKPFSAPKKEKVAASVPANISLDITSNTYTGNLPSVENKDMIGSGSVVGELGIGGMAKVFKIWNEKLEIFRAVKVLLPTNQANQRERFATEAKISAKLHHPNIVSIHDTGNWRGLPYIEMDYIDGSTLGSFIYRCKALPSMVCSAIAVQVARALSYAHTHELVIYGTPYKGIIHRDLKPSNIMIGRNGSICLMDFGIARPLETGLHTIDTQSIVGTMPYFSPEQINGYPVDQQTDIYSFGVVLYEMLCGVNPFPQSNMFELVQAKTKNQFKRLEEFNIYMDPHLSSVAQMCLRTEKQNRFQRIEDTLNHLEKIHHSYKMGSPEEVLIQFIRNPDSLYVETKRRFAQQVNNHFTKVEIPNVLPAQPEASARFFPPELGNSQQFYSMDISLGQNGNYKQF
jgi:serine/threonine protein kinase